MGGYDTLTVAINRFKSCPQFGEEMSRSTALGATGSSQSCEMYPGGRISVVSAALMSLIWRTNAVRDSWGFRESGGYQIDRRNVKWRGGNPVIFS